MMATIIDSAFNGILLYLILRALWKDFEEVFGDEDDDGLDDVAPQRFVRSDPPKAGSAREAEAELEVMRARRALTAYHLREIAKDVVKSELRFYEPGDLVYHLELDHPSAGLFFLEIRTRRWKESFVIEGVKELEPARAEAFGLRIRECCREIVRKHYLAP